MVGLEVSMGIVVASFVVCCPTVVTGADEVLEELEVMTATSGTEVVEMMGVLSGLGSGAIEVKFGVVDSESVDDCSGSTGPIDEVGDVILGFAGRCVEFIASVVVGAGIVGAVVLVVDVVVVLVVVDVVVVLAVVVVSGILGSVAVAGIVGVVSETATSSSRVVMFVVDELVTFSVAETASLGIVEKLLVSAMLGVLISAVVCFSIFVKVAPSVEGIVVSFCAVVSITGRVVLR